MDIQTDIEQRACRAWTEIDGWRATLIVELRHGGVPTETALHIERSGDLPKRRLAGRLARDIPYEELFQAGRAALIADLERQHRESGRTDDAWQLEAQMVALAPRPGSRGPLGDPDTHLARWAADYVRAREINPRAPIGELVRMRQAELAKSHDPNAYARQKVAHARRRKLLTPTSGRSGGGLTPIAIAILRSEETDRGRKT